MKINDIFFTQHSCVNTLNVNVETFRKPSKTKVNLLTEAEEECIDTHVVHAEESMSYEVAAKHHSLKQHRFGKKATM